MVEICRIEKVEQVNEINGKLSVMPMHDKKLLIDSEICRIFTNEMWSNLAGNTKKYKNNIYHLKKVKKEIGKYAIIGNFSK